MLVRFGADQNFILSGGSTKTSPSVDGITDHCKLHPIRGAHEPMHNSAAMNPNPEVCLTSYTDPSESGGQKRLPRGHGGGCYRPRKRFLESGIRQNHQSLISLGGSLASLQMELPYLSVAQGDPPCSFTFMNGANRRRVQTLEVLSSVETEKSPPVDIAEISEIVTKIGAC